MFQDVFVIGATGRMGSAFINQLFEKEDQKTSLHENPVRIVGLASHSTYLYDGGGIDPATAIAFSKREKVNTEKYTSPDELLERATSTRKRKASEVTFVDVTDSRGLLPFHLELMLNTNHRMVTANKHPLVDATYDEFRRLTREPARYGYRCTVMSGAEVLPVIRDLRDLRDIPIEFNGCLSGTLSYICNELEQGRNLSAIVRDAFDKGYTESDPKIDLSGADVLKKMVILARTAGYNISSHSINAQPFIAPEMYILSEGASFFDSLALLDEVYGWEFEEAIHKREAIRYVGILHSHSGKQEINVGLQKVPLQGPLGALNGFQNKIQIYSPTYGRESPLVIGAPGAGLRVTALGLRKDLSSLLQRRILVD